MSKKYLESKSKFWIHGRTKRVFNSPHRAVKKQGTQFSMQIATLERDDDCYSQSFEILSLTNEMET